MAAAARRGLPLVSGPSTSRALPSLPEGGEAAGGSADRERSREDGGGLTGRAGWTASQGAGAPSSTSSIASEWGAPPTSGGGAAAGAEDALGELRVLPPPTIEKVTQRAWPSKTS